MMSFGMNLLVLLEVLGALEALLADLAYVGLEGSMNAKMRGDMVALCTGGTAVLPLAGQTEIVGGLAADMVIAQVIVEVLWVGE